MSIPSDSASTPATAATPQADWRAAVAKPSHLLDGNHSNPPAATGEQEDVWPRRDEEPQSKRDRLKQPKSPPSWLDGDPFGWIGRKLRNRKTGATFTVRNVYRNGRVEVEKSWMTYTYTVEMIRADFETYS